MNSEEHTQTVKENSEDLRASCTIYRVQQTSTHTMYTKDGMKHRVDGPAMISGDKEWYYIDGYLKTPNQHTLYRQLLSSYDTCANEEFYYTQAMCRPTGIYTTSNDDE